MSISRIQENNRRQSTICGIYVIRMDEIEFDIYLRNKM